LINSRLPVGLWIAGARPSPVRVRRVVKEHAMTWEVPSPKPATSSDQTVTGCMMEGNLLEAA